MTERARRDGLTLLSWILALFLLASLAMANVTNPQRFVDFKAVYFASRCMMRGVNPYDEHEFMRVYQGRGEGRSRRR